MFLLQQDRKVRSPSRQATRRSGHKKTKPKTGTVEPAADGFLNHRFLPMMEQVKALSDHRSIEHCFFRSVKNFSDLYGFTKPELNDKVFPHNIWYAYNHLAGCLAAIRPDLMLAILQDENNKAYLSTLKIYNTRTSLYYIPVRPLYHLIKQRGRRARLLSSIFAYFLQIASIPYYWQSSSFLAGCYETIKEWTMDNFEDYTKDELRDIKNELKLQDKGGGFMLKNLSKASHLIQFSKRLNDFNPQTRNDKQLMKIASATMDLMTNYSTITLCDNVIPGITDPTEEERVQPEHYISFMWEEKGWLYDQVIEYVNSCIQEYAAIDEPLSVQAFIIPQKKETHDLEFEEKFFPLLDELIYYLNTIK